MDVLGMGVYKVILWVVCWLAAGGSWLLSAGCCRLGCFDGEMTLYRWLAAVLVVKRPCV